MKILITGYKGFIGQNIVKALSGKHVLSFHEIDDEFPNIRGLDWVIHLGAVSATTGGIEEVMVNNYEFSLKLYDECVKHNVNLQWASSASVYGTTDSFVEANTPNPGSPYSWSKYLMERYIEQNPSDIIVQGFRYFNVYGPHEDHKGNMASPYHKFSEEAKGSKTITLFKGSSKFLRDFIPVSDVIDMHMQFLDKNISGVFNMGTGVAKSFLDVAKEIQKEYPGTELNYIPMPLNIKQNYQKYTCADMSKTRDIL